MKGNIVRKVVLFLAVAFSTHFQGFAGVDEEPVGARRVALGGAIIGLRGDFWNMFSNPAGIAGLKNPTAGIYMERRYLLSQMNHGAFGFALPFQEKHYAGIEGSGFGFGGYNETRVALTYATVIADKFSLGVKANYTRTSIENYGSAGALHFDLGFHTQITKTFGAGFRVYNATQAYVNKPAGEKLPTLFTLGLAWQPSEKALLVADVEKNVNYPLSFRGGVEYMLAKSLKARVGFSTAPVNVTAGLGLVVNKFMIDFASSYHQQLGFTPHLGLTWRFGS